MREQTLTCFVPHKIPRSKLPAHARIPKKVDSIPTDVIARGRPRLYADVDSQDRLAASHDGLGRKSAISEFTEHPNGGIIGLGIGHGILPVGNGHYVSGRWSAGVLEVLVEHEDAEPGGLWFDASGNDADFTMIRFSDLEPSSGLSGHLLAMAPIVLAPRQIAKGDCVQYIAPKRGCHIEGMAIADSVDPFTLYSENKIGIECADLIAVAAETVPFSVRTESGSLVFGQDRRAVGCVVGGKRDKKHGIDVIFMLRDFGTLRAYLQGVVRSLFGKVINENSNLHRGDKLASRLGRSC